MTTHEIPITITNDGSATFQTTNIFSDFQVRLNPPIQLWKGKWCIGLQAIQYPQAIDNLNPECNLLYWDGKTERRIVFPTTFCDNIPSVISFIQEELKRTEILNLFKALNQKKEFLRFRRSTSLSPSPPKIQTIQRSRQIPPITIENLKLDSENDYKLRKVLSPIYKVVTDSMMNNLIETSDETNIPKNAIETLESFLIRQKINKVPKINLEEIENEKESYPIECKLDSLNRCTIKCESEDFDIGFSDDLITVTGFTKPKFQLNAYKRRRIFQTYLMQHSRNIFFLIGKGLAVVKKIHEIYFTIEDKDHYLDKMNRLKYINHLIVHVLEINHPENIFYDIMNQNDLSRRVFEPSNFNQKWVNLFPMNELLFLVQKFTRDDETFNELTSIQKGSILAYYMIKTLCFESPLKKENKANRAPYIHNMNDSFLIYSNLVEPYYFNESKSPLLGIITTPLSQNSTVKSVKYEFSNIQYLPCAQQTGIISTVRIYISSPDGKIIPFQRGPIIVQLKLKRFPENE